MLTSRTLWTVAHVYTSPENSLHVTEHECRGSPPIIAAVSSYEELETVNLLSFPSTFLHHFQERSPHTLTVLYVPSTVSGPSVDLATTFSTPGEPFSTC